LIISVNGWLSLLPEPIEADTNYMFALVGEACVNAGLLIVISIYR